MKITHGLKEAACISLLLSLPLGAFAQGDPERAVSGEEDTEQMMGSAPGHETDYKGGASARTQEDVLEDEHARGRMGGDMEASGDISNEVRGVLNGMLAASVAGDIDTYLDGIAKEDRNRMDRDLREAQLPNISDRFDKQWQEKYGRSFRDGIADAQLPLRANRRGDDRGEAHLRTTKGDLTFQLVRGGWFGGGWRVDVPTSIDGPAIQRNLSDAVSRLNVQSLPADVNQAYAEAAFDLLKPVSSSAAHETPEGLDMGQGTTEHM